MSNLSHTFTGRLVDVINLQPSDICLKDIAMTSPAPAHHLAHTSTGRLVDVLNLQLSDICLEDIAQGLSQTCRFGAQSPVYYSVAEHAVHVATLVESYGGPEAALLALHHDDGEAYLGDVPRPRKRATWFHFNGLQLEYDTVEDDALTTILAALGIPMDAECWNGLIHDADNAVLAAELRAFWGPSEEADRLDPRLKKARPLPDPFLPAFRRLDRQAVYLDSRGAKTLYLVTHERLMKAVSMGVA